MAQITLATTLALCDNVAKWLLDVQTCFGTNATNNTPTIATLTAGLNAATNSLVARVVGTGDLSQQLTLESPASVAAASLTGMIAAPGSAATYYPVWGAYCDALDRVTSGLAAFLIANGGQVHSAFATCFNWYAANAIALGLRGQANAPTVLPTSVIFPPTAVDPLGTLVVTGGSSSVFTPNQSIATSLYGNIALLLYNGGATSLTGSGSVTATVLQASGASISVTKNVIGPLAVGSAAGVPLGASGVAVTNMTATITTYPYTLKISAPLVRQVTY